MKLRLPAIRQPGQQLALWDWVGNIEFTSWAQHRNATGDFVEELAKSLFGGHRMTTDGQADICPDIELTKRDYIETKSIGRGKAGILYEHILDRGRRFVRRNKCRLWYVLAIHTLKAKDHADLFTLRRHMAASIDRIIVVPFNEIVRVTEALPLEVLNYRAAPRNGEQDAPEREMPGWKLPVRQLKAWSTGQPRFAFDLKVYGNPAGGFPIYQVGAAAKIPFAPAKPLVPSVEVAGHSMTTGAPTSDQDPETGTPDPRNHP